MRRDISKVFLDFCQDFVGFKIAHHTQHGVIGCVVRLKEAADVIHSCSVEVFHRSDCRMLIYEVVVRSFQQDFERPSIRLVVVTFAAFFLYRLALVVEIRLVDHQRTHAVGFEE